MAEAPSVGVRCGNCGGNVFMATCDHFRGSGHEWVLMGACMICRAVNWTDDGCPECKDGGETSARADPKELPPHPTLK